MQRSAWVVGAGLLALVFSMGRSSAGVGINKQELHRMRQANLRLRQKLHVLEAMVASRAEEEERSKPSCPPPTLTAAKTIPSSETSTLGQFPAQAHNRWDWKSIAIDVTQPYPTIKTENLESAVAACNDNGTMYCQRAQIYNGQLYITDYRAIFFDRKYAPSRIMPLLETLRQHPDLPDIDIVISGNDEPRFASIPGNQFSWSKMCAKWPGESGKLPPVTFSNTVNRGAFDLPWPDFAWFFPRKPHKLRTPPWSILHEQLIEAGGRASWEEKMEFAMHTGNVGSLQRKKLAQVAQEHPGEVLVNEVFIGDHSKNKRCSSVGLHDKGGFQQHKCFMKFEDQCKYKYLLNTASVGYANKFKSLLLCGSVVLYVREGMRHKEFYELGLLPGVHYVAVDTPEDVPATVKWLRENDNYARAVAVAGRERMKSLDVSTLTNFMSEVFRQYAKKQSFTVKPQPGAVRINCEDDLWRHYSIYPGFFKEFGMQDNSTCIKPPIPGTRLEPPGWGGAYIGSKPRCVAGHDLLPRAQPHACDFDKPFSTAESYTPWGEFPRPHPKHTYFF